MDIFLRKVIGWQLDKRMSSDLIEKALQNAFMDCRVDQGIFFILKINNTEIMLLARGEVNNKQYLK